MNRLLGLFLALGLGLWAQRILTGSVPGVPRDALILFILAAAVFIWNAAPPSPLRRRERWAAPPWPRDGWKLSVLGLLLGLASLALLWRDLHSLPGLLLWPAATALFIAGTLVAPRRSPLATRHPQPAPDPAPLATRHPQPASDPALPATRHSPPARLFTLYSLLFVILLLAAAFRFYQLNLYPNGCQSDECNNGLDALKWLGGAPYTPYAETNEGQATLFTYLIALSFRLFGVGVWQMRLVSAVVGVLTVAAFYLLARQLTGRRAALAVTAALAASRWHITFSRIVYELIMQPLVMIVLVGLMLAALRTGKRWQWALAGVALAVGMNTYTAFRIVPFVVAAFLAFWLARDAVRTLAVRRRGDASAAQTLRGDVQGAAVMAGGAALAVLPLGVYIVRNWSVFTGRIRHISILPDVERLQSWQPVLDNLKKTLYMFNWRGDQAALNNLPGAPMLDTVIAVLFVLGLAYVLWYALRLRSWPVLAVLWFVGILSLGVLSVAHEAPSARRTIGLIPLIYLLAAGVLQQFFLAWDRAWRGMGRSLFNVAVGAVVVGMMISNARLYFHVQAQEPSVWSAYSPNESAVGRYVSELPAGAQVLITPQFQHHSAVRLIGGDHPYRALNPVDDVPFRSTLPAGQELVYVLEPVDQPLLALLKQIYPKGQEQDHADRYGEPLFLSFEVSGEDFNATQGLVGQFFRTFPPVEAADAMQVTRELDVDLAAAPLAAPYFALWEGTLLVPQYGRYQFDLQADAQEASLELGRQQRVTTDASGSARLETTLAAGFHTVRVEVQSGATPGRLRLSWSGPAFVDATLGGDALYTFDLGNQGLVGYYYPNGDWSGKPALVRNDWLITPNNPLHEPFSILWRGKLAAPVSGVYTLGTRSDDGSFVSVDGQLVVDNGGSHGAEERSGQIVLDQGFHNIEVRYNELGGSREMQLWWQPPGQGRAVIASQYLFPLEGEEIPAGLIMPPPPQIAQAIDKPPAGAAKPPGPSQGPAAPQIEPSGDFPVLPATLAWTFGETCGSALDALGAAHGVAVDPASGDVFVADTGNNRLVRLDAEGRFVGSWGQPGAAAAQFTEVVDVAVAPDGLVLALDAVNQRVSRWRATGEFVDSFGDALAFYRPRGFSVDAAGQVLVADTGGVRIVRMDAAGALQGQWGGSESDLARQQPTDAVLTPGGVLFFVEAESGAVTRIDAAGEVKRWSGPAPASTLDGPHMALLPDGRLLVTDPEGRRVLLFDANGAPLGQFGVDAGLVKPVGVAVDATGTRVLVADSAACRVLAFDLP